MIRAGALPLPLTKTEQPRESKVRSFSVDVRWLFDGDCRMDSPFYADEAVVARRAIDYSGFPIKQLDDIEVTEDLFWPGRFKRIYTDNPNEGFPFLQASATLMFRPNAHGWLAKSQSPNPKNYFAQEGWILVTRSGVVGRCLLIGKRLTQFFLSEDLIRIIPTLPTGYLYAFLSTWMGQALMVKEQYGGTITHLEPYHLQKIPVPLLPEGEQRTIHEQIMKAYGFRDEANDLLDQADEMLHKELGLTRFDESKVSYLGGVTKPKAFAVQASELAERFDASFHLPIAKAAIRELEKGKYPLVQLSALAERIFIPPRFKRIYVEPEHGVPFLRPSDIPMLKPYDLKYLSRHATSVLDQLMLRVGDILVTTDGTVGRIGLVPKQLEGWAGSNNIGRITYCSDNNRSGYVAAFLMTPFGHYQVTREIYGGVVDHLEKEHIAGVLLPNAPLDVQERIGTLVVQAFEKKEEANQIEEHAIRALEKAITKK